MWKSVAEVPVIIMLLDSKTMLVGRVIGMLKVETAG